MYQKILIPLDGSELAECALSHVKNLKLVEDGSGAEVTLLNVIIWDYNPHPEDAKDGASIDIEAHRKNIRKKLLNDSGKYLADAKSRLGYEDIKVKTVSLDGIRAADTISDYAKNNGIDLLIIATHGYTGLKKMMLGSVALELLHDAHMPVLLIRPEACRV
jgi:nucleotide-binding universal stress UspA family protein